MRARLLLSIIGWCSLTIFAAVADEPSLLEITVSVPTPADQGILAPYTPPLLIPVIIRIKNDSNDAVYLPDFNPSNPPFKIALPDGTSPVIGYVPRSASQVVKINGGETYSAVLDVASQVKFAWMGTYNLGYTYEFDYTFYPITADAKPDSYKSHRVSGNGSAAVPVNATNSTYGLAEIYGPIGAGVFILLMIGWIFLRKSTQRDYVLEEAPGLTDRLSNIDE